MGRQEQSNTRASTGSRRRFIKLLAGSVSCAGVLPTLVTAAVRPDPGSRSLVFHHLHTGETLEAEYWHDGHYDRNALTAVDHVLRDFRTGDVHAIDRELLDLLHRVQRELGVYAPFQVIGGYRSPRTNKMLRARSSGVAKRSLHMQGRAIDVRIPGVRTALLREAAADLRIGGVGYYRASDFVHLDTGRPRSW